MSVSLRNEWTHYPVVSIELKLTIHLHRISHQVHSKDSARSETYVVMLITVASWQTKKIADIIAVDCYATRYHNRCWNGCECQIWPARDLSSRPPAHEGINSVMDELWILNQMPLTQRINFSQEEYIFDANMFVLYLKTHIQTIF